MYVSLNIVIASEFELAEKIIEQLEQSDIPVSAVTIAEIYPFDDEYGLRFNGRSVAQKSIEEIEWSDYQYLFFAGEVKFVPYLAKASEAGCITIDLLATCAVLPDIPLIVPSINDHLIDEVRNRNIIALADPQISQLLLSCYSQIVSGNIQRLFVSSLLPASYFGDEKVKNLAGQTARLLNGISLDEDEQRLAFDVSPVIDSHYAVERLYNQFQRITLNTDIQLVIHCVQSAVFYGLAQQITALGDYQVELDSWQLGWQQQHELITVEQEKVITPVSQGELESSASVIHISAIKALENGIQFWTVCDEQRFSIAKLGVKLVELAYQNGY